MPKILPNHYDRPDPDLHARRFRKWVKNKLPLF
jgi:hypothetical protein